MGFKVLQLGHNFFSFDKGVSVGYNGFVSPPLITYKDTLFMKNTLEKYGRIIALLHTLLYTIHSYSYIGSSSVTH